MIFIEQIAESVRIFFGLITILLVIAVLMHGYRNEVLAWPYAAAMLLFGPMPVFLYILHVILQFRRDNIWKEKPSAMNKYPVTRFPSDWKGNTPKPKKPMDPSLRKSPGAKSEEEFDGYESPPDWEI